MEGSVSRDQSQYNKSASIYLEDRMSFDLLKEHLQAVAMRLDEKTDKKSVTSTSVKKSHSKQKADKAVNYIGE